MRSKKDSTKVAETVAGAATENVENIENVETNEVEEAPKERDLNAELMAAIASGDAVKIAAAATAVANKAKVDAKKQAEEARKNAKLEAERKIAEAKEKEKEEVNRVRLELIEQLTNGEFETLAGLRLIVNTTFPTPDTPAKKNKVTKEATATTPATANADGFIVTPAKEKRDFIEPYITEAKYTKKELQALLEEQFPLDKPGSMRVFLTDCQNIRFNRFPKLCTVNADGIYTWVA